MTRPIEAKKGSPLFDAAFSLVTEAIITTYDTELERFWYKRLDSKTPAKLKMLIKSAMQSDEIHVYNQPNQKKAFLCSDKDISHQYVSGIINQNEVVSEVAIYTADVDRIRMLAKELRADKVVAKAAKKPTKPKADLKTRKDII